MGLLRLVIKGLFLSLFVNLPLFSSYPQNSKASILNLAYNDKIIDAFCEYINEYKKNKEHDFSLLRKLSLSVLKRKILNPNLYTQYEAILGAGISGSSEALEILEKGLSLNNPNLQLFSLSFLNNFLEEKSLKLLVKTLSSPYLPIKLEAAYRLVELQNTDLIHHLNSFSKDVPEVLKPSLINLYLLLDNEESEETILSFLSNDNIDVRKACITLIGLHKKDQYLPSIRPLLNGTNCIEKEAAIFTVGLLKDQKSIPKLKQFLNHSDPKLRLSAASSLAYMGLGTVCIDVVKTELTKENTFVPYVLRNFNSEIVENLLTSSLHLENPLSFNSLLTLLEKNLESQALTNTIIKTLVSEDENSFFWPAFSPARTLLTFQVFSGGTGLETYYPGINSITHKLKEEILFKASRLPKHHFLKIAEAIFDSNQSSLIPLLTTLITQKNDNELLFLLKNQSQKPGAPLIRHFSNLALYEMTSDKEAQTYLINKAQSMVIKNLSLIPKEEARINLNFSKENSLYTLSLEDETNLFISTLETLVKKKSDDDVNLILEMLILGKEKNISILAGLLVKITE